MTKWTEDELTQIGGVEELQLASQRQDGTMRSFITMWDFRVGEDLYVRSAHGPTNPWYRRAKASRAGRIRAGGLERAVTFADPDQGVHAALDSAYHAKYDRYGPKIVGSVVGTEPATVTIKLVPRSSQS